MQSQTESNYLREEMYGLDLAYLPGLGNCTPKVALTKLRLLSYSILHN